MPIHDQSYRHFEGPKAPPGRAWLVIAKAGVMHMIRKRLFLGLLIVCLGAVPLSRRPDLLLDQFPPDGDARRHRRDLPRVSSSSRIRSSSS